MSVLFGILFIGFLVWAVYGRYRVITAKRYATLQREAPDLGRFAEGSVSPRPGADTELQ